MTKVLVAEDHVEMRRLLGETLRAAGYDVVELQDGADLLREITESLRDEDNPRAPDLIVSDLRMPGSTGLQALERLRAFDWVTPVILVSAFVDLPTMLEASRLGATRVFSKPFDLQDLVALARALVAPTA